MSNLHGAVGKEKRATATFELDGHTMHSWDGYAFVSRFVSWLASNDNINDMLCCVSHSIRVIRILIRN